MDSTNKNTPKIDNQAPTASYNPWNLLFKPRNRTESESSTNSNISSPQNYQPGANYNMDSTNNNSPKINNQAPTASYNPWNLLFRPRNRTESETSTNSNQGTQFGGFQRQTSKSNEDYLWMMWRS